MEKAMHQSHGVSYAQYSRCFQTRMRIERERQQNYYQSLAIVQERNQKFFG
jgi:hypothetical protein